MVGRVGMNMHTGDAKSEKNRPTGKIKKRWMAHREVGLREAGNRLGQSAKGDLERDFFFNCWKIIVCNLLCSVNSLPQHSKKNA